MPLNHKKSGGSNEKNHIGVNISAQKRYSERVWHQIYGDGPGYR
jgi:hypothetical protein